MKNKVLIITKDPKSKGGVVNYYNNFFNSFSDDEIQLEWFVIGSRAKDYYERQNRGFKYFIELLRDIFAFISKLIVDKEIKIVQVSPSFFTVPVIRDFIFLFIAQLFGKKTITFIRGWNTKYSQQKSFWKTVMFRTYKKADETIVLAGKFKDQLVNFFGFDPNKVSISRTMFNKEDIVLKEKFEDETLKIVFLSRISKEKGIFQILEAINLLKDQKLNYKINVFGHFANTEIEKEIKELISKHGIEQYIEFCGFADKATKFKAYAENDIFILPTAHDEGCPNSVIEALGAGLYVMATPVGAIDEIVKNKINGDIISIDTHKDLMDSIKYCVENKATLKPLAHNNIDYANNNFEQNVIVSQIKGIYRKLLK
ncbi:glycosyltransferase family 4 protein [Flammeovirga agarivorans]|uniref:Glycosyltransferase family 4 protein n=1 Tax=Flammeovirga agarivorans TaxID=2726742 RepID=A0A7X8XY97_9BACT|nr:glycosyltransferase family 4 protein [Flammeovirga agarivorans]NLR93933.1 glycosyltransferase family 4 protein [Flammeovirga agarivorans]